MALQGDGAAGEAEAEGEAEARGGGGSGAEPSAEAGGGHGGLTGDGAERKGRVSGQLSSRLAVLLQRGGRRAEQRYPPSRPAASSLVDGDSRQPSRGPGEESGDAYDKKQDEAREAPLSAAAMLNIFRSIPTQMVGQPPPEHRPRPGPRPLGRRGCVRVVAFPFRRAVSVPAREELLSGLRAGTPYRFDRLV